MGFPSLEKPTIGKIVSFNAASCSCASIAACAAIARYDSLVSVPVSLVRRSFLEGAWFLFVSVLTAPLRGLAVVQGTGDVARYFVCHSAGLSIARASRHDAGILARLYVSPFSLVVLIEQSGDQSDAYYSSWFSSLGLINRLIYDDI